MNLTQIQFSFEPVRVVKNKWTDIWHVMKGHLVWPDDTDQVCFQSIEDAVFFAKRHGANPQVPK